MTKHDCKSGNPLHPSKNTPEWLQQLNHLDNGLYRLVCAYRFYHCAIEAIAAKEEEPDQDQEWRYGLFLVGEWLDDSGRDLMQVLDDIKKQAIEG